MKKVVRVLMSLAAGLDTGIATYEQLSRPPAQPEERQKVGFVSRPSDTSTFVDPGPGRWVNKKK